MLATVNGLRITKNDLSAEVQARVVQLQQQVIEARKRELDLQINSTLLNAEAKRQGINAQQLLQNEVVAKTKEPTDAEAQSFYNENKARIKGEFAALKEDIKEYLRNERQRVLALSLSERLRTTTPVMFGGSLCVKPPRVNVASASTSSAVRSISTRIFKT